MDFIQERGSPIGALLTLRDAESVRRIQDEIELSRQMSASGRTTRGVAHEVKNPINAIVLHLQLLQSKLKQIDPDTRRHMDIIGSEIHRLDRVVQILVDFTRPRDLRLEEIDLRHLLEDVIMLATPDTDQHGVTIKRRLGTEPLGVRVDADVMKQAILNVIINGMQAMPKGGTLNYFRPARRGQHSHRNSRPRYRHTPRTTGKDLRTVFHHQKRWQRDWVGTNLSGPAVALWLDRFRDRRGTRHHLPSSIASLFNPSRREW